MKKSLLAAALLAVSATPALAAMNPCAAKPAMNPCAAKPAMNPCAAKPAMAGHMSVQSVNPKTVNPAKITYSQLKALEPKDLMMVAKRGMASGQMLMGGMAVGGRHVELTGQIVDLACYESAGMTGGHHALCARVCALEGAPVGLLTHGKVYLILPAHSGKPVAKDVLDSIAKTVRVQGNVNGRGGLSTIAITHLKTL